MKWRIRLDVWSRVCHHTPLALVCVVTLQYVTSFWQGPFCACAPPMGDNVLLQRRLLLAGCIQMIPASSRLAEVWTFMAVGSRRNIYKTNINWNFCSKFSKLNSEQFVITEVTYMCGMRFLIEFWEWKNDFIPHFMKDVTTYPCWD